MMEGGVSYKAVIVVVIASYQCYHARLKICHEALVQLFLLEDGEETVSTVHTLSEKVVKTHLTSKPFLIAQHLIFIIGL